MGRVARDIYARSHLREKLYYLCAGALILFVLFPCAPVGAEDTYLVTTARDGGVGSLSQAILEANQHTGPFTIRFDAVNGPFSTPQTIRLESPLPEVRGTLTIDGYIDDRLWQASGVTLDGNNRFRVLSVAEGAKVTLRSVTVARGRAERGGGIDNRGELILHGVTFIDNAAGLNGGAVASDGETLTLVNSTFYRNRAGWAGGAVASAQSTVTVTNATFAENSAPTGAGLFSRGLLLVRNSIFANSEVGEDCVSEGENDPASTHNLIENNRGCGGVISAADPRLGKMGRYNGPTSTLPLGAGSPAINMGDNVSAVDEQGRPLRWDQRGNGDPRFVAGITDLGAFERQANVDLTVDTAEDIDLRACGRRISADCSLRGALALANVARKPPVITFDDKVFSGETTIRLGRPLPRVTQDLTIDARSAGGVVLEGRGGVQAAEGVTLTLHQVTVK